MPNVIWFNGPSATTLIETLPQQPVEIGCNRIYEHRAVDHVCVYDWQMLDRVERGPFKLWCRNGIKHPEFREVSYSTLEQPHNSGVMAVLLARNLGLRQCHIIGCDWGITNESRYDYGDRNSILKYTNSQKQLMESIRRSGIDLILVNDNAVDLNLPQVSHASFLRSL